jgi:NAD kinase
LKFGIFVHPKRP